MTINMEDILGLWESKLMKNRADKELIKLEWEYEIVEKRLLDTLTAKQIELYNAVGEATTAIQAQELDYAYKDGFRSAIQLIMA